MLRRFFSGIMAKPLGAVMVETMGKLITAVTVTAPKSCRPAAARKSRRAIQTLEVLEDRCCPAALYWDPTFGNIASDASNWDVGSLGSGTHPAAAPGANDTVTFSGATMAGNEPCHWDYSTTVAGVIFSNKYNQILSVLSNINLSVGTDRFYVLKSALPTLNMLSRTSSIILTNGTFAQVDGSLTLSGSLSWQSTFFTSDGKGELLDVNGGTVTYKGQSNQTDFIKVPVLNEGTFNVGGNPGSNGGPTLDVSGGDANTGSVSWYQDTSGAITNLSGLATLLVESGYTQTAGLLETTDSGPETLQAGASGTNGTININGGVVKIDNSGMNVYGELDFKGGNGSSTVNIGSGAELLFKVDCNDDVTSDHLNCDGTVNFIAGSTVGVNPQGAPNGFGDWEVMTYATETGTPGTAPTGFDFTISKTSIEVAG